MSIESGGAVGNLRLLARGPVAEVYVGRSAETGADVAVKLFAERLDRDTAALLDRERAALEAVRSVRSVLPIDGTVVDGAGRSGVRMELCRGSLAGLLDTAGALGVPDVLAIGCAAATALAAAHNVGVVHGGVTPANVLFRGTGEVVLADFGLALRERFPRDPVHAVEFTAPETLRDDTRSSAADLYGLGAVLHTALTGQPPFPRRAGQQPGERILQVLRDEALLIRDPGVPPELSTVVHQLLAKDPAARPPDAAAVADRLDRLRRATTPAPAPVPVAGPASAWAPPPVPVSNPVPVQVPVAGPVHPDPPTIPIPVPIPVPTPLSVPDRPASEASEPEPDAGSEPGSEPDDFDFDDFDEVTEVNRGPQVNQTPEATPAAPVPAPAQHPTSAPVPAPVAAPDPTRPPIPPPGGRTLVREFDGGEGTGQGTARSRWRRGAAVGVGVALVGLATVAVVGWRGGSATPSAQSATTAPPTQPAVSSVDTPAVKVTVSPPTDDGDAVELAWSAAGDFDFAVVVAGEKIDTMVLVANREHSMRVPVDRTRRYCFQVRATDGQHVYQSDPVPVRGAHCNP